MKVRGTVAPSLERGHLSMLDGWRALSITLVMAAHLLPLGPKSWNLNVAVAALGMTLFFTLSGFLITRMLLTVDVRTFLIRRFFRIVPLAWLAMAIVLPFAHADAGAYPAHFLFYANLPPFWLTNVASHLWSLCVEVQFYVAIALAVSLFGRRALFFLPIVCLAVTGLRIFTGTEISIVTWLRVDEILAGGIMALIYEGRLGLVAPKIIARLNVYGMLGLAFLACLPTPLAYARPYLASATVAASLFNGPPVLRRIAAHRVTVWLADISYALYVIHGFLMNTWLGEGSVVVKYAKRPLLLVVTIWLAHISTTRYERRWIAFGKQLSSRVSAPVPIKAP